MSPACEIILLAYDKLEYTRPCVESILAHTEGPFHLTIVDNGSVQPQSREYLAGIERQNPFRVSLLRLESNQGYIGGVNAGLAAVCASANGPEFLCVISNDTVVFPGWLSEMLSVARADPAVGLVNPQWQFDRRDSGNLAAHAMRLLGRYRGQSVEMDWCRGFCFVLRRSLYETIGGLDKAFSPGYFDDWDYSVRAIRAGFICMLAQGAFVRHYINATFASQLGKAGVNALYEERRQLFYRRWGRQLKVLFIASRKEDRAQLDGVRAAAMRLVRGQDHLYMLTDAPELCISHTNCFLKKTLSGFVFLRAAANILNNLRYQKAKRYAMIICSEKMKKGLERFCLLRNCDGVVTFESIAANPDGFRQRVQDCKFRLTVKD